MSACRLGLIPYLCAQHPLAKGGWQEEADAYLYFNCNYPTFHFSTLRYFSTIQSALEARGGEIWFENPSYISILTLSSSRTRGRPSRGSSGGRRRTRPAGYWRTTWAWERRWRWSRSFWSTPSSMSGRRGHWSSARRASCNCLYN